MDFLVTFTSTMAMSRELAESHKKTVRLIEIPQGHHNTIQESHTDEVVAALREIGGSAE